MTTPAEVAHREDTLDKVQVLVDGDLLNLAQAEQVCNVLSRSELVPTSLYGKPASIFHVVMAGQHLGLHWTTALQVIYSPSRGQIGLRTAYLLAKIRIAGHDYDWEEGEDYCEFTLMRKDREKPYKTRFTLADAERAGLVQRAEDGSVVALSQNNKPMPWMQYTPDLLFARAVARGITRGAPELALGFEVQGAVIPEPPQQVELKPEAPAPPGPAGQPGNPDNDAAGQAATGDGQAVQAELAELDKRMRPDGDESFTITDEDVEALKPILEARPEVSQVGGIPESGGESAPEPERTADAVPEPVDKAGDEVVDDAVPATSQDLAAIFTRLGYDPKQYRERVLNACSVYLRRRIAGVRNLKASEVNDLHSELAALELRSKTSELHPVTILADQIGAWQDQWEREDPEGYAEYTGPQ